MKTLVIIRNHDDEKNETITLEQFIERFNSEQIDSSSYSITAIYKASKEVVDVFLKEED